MLTLRKQRATSNHHEVNEYDLPLGFNGRQPTPHLIAPLARGESSKEDKLHIRLGKLRRYFLRAAEESAPVAPHCGDVRRAGGVGDNVNVPERTALPPVDCCVEDAKIESEAANVCIGQIRRGGGRRCGS